VPKYRNVSGETRWVDLGGGRFPKVADGDIADFPDDWPYYVQTGDTGERPLWELVTVATPPTKKSAPAEKE